MPYSKIKKYVVDFYGGALELRNILSAELRQAIHTNLLIATGFLFILVVISYSIEFSTLGTFPGFSIASLLADRIYGLFLLLFSSTFIFSALEAFHRSYYFRGLNHVLHDTSDPKLLPVSWEVATIINETKDNDITGGFIYSSYGQEIIFRAGISEEAFDEFVKTRKHIITSEGFLIEQDKGVVLATYVRSIYKQDPDFRHFLAKSNINEKQLIHSAEWVTRIERTERIRKRWWARDNLGRIPGIGKNWSYGETYFLEKYGHEMIDDPIWPSALMTRREEDDEVEQLENVLSRTRQSNALLITDDTMNARRRVAQLYHKIREGEALPPIENRRIFYIDIESIVIDSGEKSAFENSIQKVFNQAIRSGNIILYIEHFSTAIQSTHKIGVDLVESLSQYYESEGIQIVIGEITEHFDKLLSKDTRVTQAFDIIQMSDIAENGIIELLEQRANTHEKHTGIVFTIPALETIAILADRYFPSGVMPDKAFDLLEELVPFALSHHLDKILQSDVEELVSIKTNVPLGAPKEEEREKLLSLEEKLHERVIAQNDAVDAVAKALRRARAGVGSSKKPLGTFLFLGPTGVGKTETAKALAELLFNDEEAMTRLDMSEFQSLNALEELIGSPITGQVGRLETLVRKRQYGVLLLDEFEKSDKSIQDLFLQILDEGKFTDGDGKSINMRNLVIIATSNAGAELIWEWEKEGKEITGQKKVLIDYIIKNNVYRPELLNRFDEIVVFHSLKPEQVKNIARIHLNSFAKRIEKERNIQVIITEDLINYVAEKGYDPQFGGRPLQRAIQNEVEQALADEILAGHVHPGEPFELKI